MASYAVLLRAKCSSVPQVLSPGKMGWTRTTLMTTAIIALAVTALPWAEQAAPQTRALEIRPSGDVGLWNAGLDKRGFLIPFISSMPAMTMASVTLGWCYRGKFDSACFALMAITVAMALSYAALWWTYLYKYENVQWQREAITQSYALIETEERGDRLTDVLNSEESERRHKAWKQDVERERQSWGDPIKHYLQVYENHEDVPEVKEKVDEAREKFELADTALQQYGDAAEISTTLKVFRKKKKGTLSQRDVYTLMDEAREAVEKVTEKVQELLRQHISYLEVFEEELPFFKDNDPEFSGMNRRRGLNDGMPRLLKETTENCDAEPCGRVWYSTTVRTGRKRGQFSAKDLIHNIYSTPSDFNFETDPVHRSIFRRDNSNDDDDEEEDEDEDDEDIEEIEVDDEDRGYDDDDLIDFKYPFKIKGAPVLSRFSLVPGDDMESLEQMVDSLLGDKVGTVKNFRNVLMQGNVSNFNSETWQCINADGDNGGEWAIRGVGIFTSDVKLLHADTAPMLARCSGLL